MKAKGSFTLLVLSLLIPVVNGKNSDTAQQRYQALVAEVAAANQAWEARVAELRKAEKNGGPPIAAGAFESPLIPFVARFDAVAQEYAGTDDAIPFLTWMAQNALSMVGDQRKAAKNAVRTLVTTHRSSPRLEDLEWMIGRLDYFYDAPQALVVGLKLEKESPSPKVRAYATFSRVGATINKAPVDSAEFRTAKAEMLKVLEGVEIKNLTSAVKTRIKMRENFSLGMTPPDIQGVDLDGSAFALSDYKGKVLLIDFWGDW
ncbi:MAG: TlpA family protein disulfide reductase [Akkermansiaceae bacterium]